MITKNDLTNGLGRSGHRVRSFADVVHLVVVEIGQGHPDVLHVLVGAVQSPDPRQEYILQL